MSQEVSNALADVVQQTVLMIFGIDAQVRESGTETDRETPFEVSGIIGVTGSSRGSIVISMPLSVATTMTGWMIKEPPEKCTEQDVSDCVGELANIVAGNLLAMTDGGRDTKDARLSLPGVVIGPHRVVWSRKDAPCDRVVFGTELGSFAAEVNLQDTYSYSAGA